MEKLYVLVDETLPLVHQGVQGGHALAQWLLENPQQQWNNRTLVYLKADIKREIQKLLYKGIEYTAFHEPDRNNELTAVALQCEDKYVKHLKLMC